MIERLHLIASFLGRIRGLIVILALAFAGLFAYSLFQFQADGDDLMMPAIAGLCWAVTLYSFASLFARIPERPTPQHRFSQRLSLRLRRFAMGIMALLMIALTLSVLLLSYQLLRTWFMG